MELLVILCSHIVDHIYFGVRVFPLSKKISRKSTSAPCMGNADAFHREKVVMVKNNWPKPQLPHGEKDCYPFSFILRK